jgi:hypothetical protein
MVTVVPPVIAPVAGVMDVTTGTTGFHCQLTCVMVSPQEPFPPSPLIGRIETHCGGELEIEEFEAE